MTGLDAFVGEREIASPAEMEALGRALGDALRAGDLVVLTGPLGAGKTTLTRGIAAGLGVRGRVQSPTFVIARTHPSLGDGPPLVHVDAYRLGTDGELDDLDIDFAGSVVIAEWAAPFAAAVADRWWEIEIDRGWAGTGVDTACGTAGPHVADMEDAAPRRVRITRHG
ncbi:tRNA (adenosine(37)-N6)-threonylcarbamoyltransferase complex ATPase subunit type 1 TsaE [Microbacterium aurum]|uniref:tRNA threonylcarbamoyladenosine biosynthesis protein TsaE n=1 Tax=Microbacterium aurum TaxID=36805 RepID=A0A1P8UAS0_9MICO|nr:tRNA (adenosine(37)-N6)-threonylcarbamoyltransferase complex ATPase subunit type 1 TsaE [Microbacterium aurum]APZ35193.1 tRNA (adenosine(37)-N6)-threonylcarbamoyltransferase complex ATPase subunit type 1 TsaE [Microbacterium aurum]MBM7829167.1 tRNA threonylcarbamoyl adenosine modification protein YjeE [Microbacterium aurum]